MMLTISFQQMAAKALLGIGTMTSRAALVG